MPGRSSLDRASELPAPYRPQSPVVSAPPVYRPVSPHAAQRVQSPHRPAEACRPAVKPAFSNHRLGAIQRMEQAEVPQPVQQPNAGTKPLAFTTDNKYVVKIGSEREEFTYRNRQALGLGSVLVGSVREPIPLVSLETNLIEGVLIDEEDSAKKLTQPIPQPDKSKGERLIVTRRLGEGKKDNAFTMDVKIGYHTKSGEQFELEGKGWWERQGKKIEHNLKDLPFLMKMGPFFHGSGWRGFDVDSKGAKAFHEYKGHDNFDKCLGVILRDIKSIWRRMQGASMVFVGSSLFCFFDLEHPDHSSAKILDPDHPILHTRIEGLGEYPKTLMREETLNKDRGWEDYRRRYVDSFMDGLVTIYNALESKDI
jgi:hypothetical protein